MCAAGGRRGRPSRQRLKPNGASLTVVEGAVRTYDAIGNDQAGNEKPQHLGGTDGMVWYGMLGPKSQATRPSVGRVAA